MPPLVEKNRRWPDGKFNYLNIIKQKKIVSLHIHCDGKKTHTYTYSLL